MNYSDSSNLENLTIEELSEKLDQIKVHCKIFTKINIPWAKGNYHFTYAMGKIMMDNTISNKNRLIFLDQFVFWQQTLIAMALMSPQIKELHQHYEDQLVQLKQIIAEKQTANAQ